MKAPIVLLLIALAVHGSVALAGEKAIGMIKVSKGEAFVLRDGKRIDAQLGTSVLQRDVLETGKSGSLGVTLKDNTRLSLGPNSQLNLKEFTFNPRQEEYSFITEMARGTLVYISGMMGKLSPESVSVESPVATIGIRGTRFLLRIGNGSNAESPEDVRPES